MAGYFMDGLRYLQSGGTTLAGFQPLKIEQYVKFEVGGHPFCGYIDLICRSVTDEFCIVDHKSRVLKDRGNRRVKSNALLDEYLRQLYLYSIPVASQFGTPDCLAFNCFRSGKMIKEPFSQAAFIETIDWALCTIESILHEKDWLPCGDDWKCKHLCGMAEECEYYN